MDVRLSPRDEDAYTLVLRRDELPAFRALLERASFVDTRPQDQAQALDLARQLLEELPEAGAT